MEQTESKATAPHALITAETIELAANLAAADFTNGRMTAANCAVVFIGSSPQGLVSLNSGIEAWTQLPQDSQIVEEDGQPVRRGFLENMYVQFSEGIPGVQLDFENENICIDPETITDDQRLQVETDWLVVFENHDPETGDIPTLERRQEALERYKISQMYAAGLYEPTKSVAVKGQVTGLFSWGLKVCDRSLRPIIYHPDFWDGAELGVIAKALMLKAAWQFDFLSKRSPNILKFVDEPYLTQVGSSQISVPNVEKLLAIEFSLFGDNVGAHCCGQTRYELLFNTESLQIAALDLTSEAWDGTWESATFAQAFVASAVDAGLQKFLERGGTIALGVVPFDHTIRIDSIVAHIERIFTELEARGIDIATHRHRFLITPTCGGGSETVLNASHAFNRAVYVANIMQREKLTI